jgi:hypothetical protein
MQTGLATLVARAPRAAVLVPVSPPGTKDSSLDRALEWCGRVWGGAYMLVVPVVDGEIDAVFARLVRLLDPDVVLVWQSTLGEVALRDLVEAREIVEGVRSRSPENSMLPTLLADADLQESSVRVRQPVDGPGVRRLLEELAPFRRTDRLLTHVAWHLQTELPAPLTSLGSLAIWPQAAPSLLQSVAAPPLALSGNALLGLPLLDLDLGEVDSWLRRLLKVRLGIVGAPPFPVPVGVRANGETAWWPQLGPETESIAICVGLTGRPPHNARLTEQGLERAPIARSTAGLQEWSHGRLQRRPFLVVVGDSEPDCCLYLAWIRLYGAGSAAWLPECAATEQARPAWCSTALEHVRDLVSDLPAQTFMRGWLTSFSVATAELELVRVELSAHYWHPDVPARFREMPIVAPDEIVLDNLPDIAPAVGDVFERGIPLLFDDTGVATAPLRSPVPAFMTSGAASVAGDLRGNWVCDVVVDSCHLPVRQQSVAAAATDEELIAEGLVRVGRTGTAFVAVVEDDTPQTLLVDHALTGVTLLRPRLEPLLDAILSPGWTWRLSDAGRFYDGFSRMAGGLVALVDLLRGSSTGPVLDAFKDPRKETPGIMLADARRYLRFSDCRRWVRSKGKTSSVAERVCCTDW